MGIPSRPRELYEQGPASNCIIDGRALGWLSCTMYAGQHAVDQATLGRQSPSGCSLRRSIGDSVGGTNLPQLKTAVEKLTSLTVDVYVGGASLTFKSLATFLRRGRGAVVQGNAGALLGTTFRSTGGYVNHAVFVSQGRGWKQNAAGDWYPAEVLVYDPAADGRAASWGRADVGPSWWSWSLLKKFAAYLRPWGDSDPRTLATLRPGRCYVAVFPDTEPHVHLRYTGSKRTDPFPDSMTIRSPTPGRKVNVRSGPSTKYPVEKTLASGTTFVAYQVNRAGQELAGSRVWYGDHNGKLWVHSSGIRT